MFCLQKDVKVAGVFLIFTSCLNRVIPVRAAPDHSSRSCRGNMQPEEQMEPTCSFSKHSPQFATGGVLRVRMEATESVAGLGLDKFALLPQASIDLQS